MKETDNNMNIRPPRTDVNQGSQTSSTRSTNSAGGVSGASSTDPAATSGDTVTLTGSVDQMAKLEQMLANVPDIDNARVDAIKASIADGSYQVDPEKIVDKLLKIEKDFS